MLDKNKFMKFKYAKYASDKSFKERLQIWFIKDHSKAIKFRIFNLILKVASCVLYVLEVLMNPPASSNTSSSHKMSYMSEPENTITEQILQLIQIASNQTAVNELNDLDEDINWHNVIYVKRHPILRNTQLAIGVYGLFESMFYFYLSYDGNLIDRLTSVFTLIDLLCTIPWLIECTIPKARDIFIPVFLNCWLIKRNLNYIFKDFNNISMKHHNSVIGQHLISLGTLFSCLIFTSVCGFQHLQRASNRKAVTLFDSLYYIIITFSTVGYGDITPDAWPSKLFMGVMIIVALVVIPTQLEHLASLWFERQNLGASYSSHRAAHEKHIVVCSTALQYDLIIDFLNEFYAHRKNHAIHTILLSSSELDIQLRSLLHTPLWKQRVFYIHGSALRDNDLERAKVQQAKAVFIIASRGIDKDLADQHSILRSWAIKDYAPKTPQFVQLFRPENKINIKFAEYVVCEDEFKYALLANNCLCPGISTLITLLLHKSKIKAKEKPSGDSFEKWQELYTKLAGNEIHSITAVTSKFFKEFVGQSFTQASFIAHKKYNVCLIGIGKPKHRRYSFSSDGIDSANELASSDDDKDRNDLQAIKSIEINKKNSDIFSAFGLFSNRNILLNPGPDYLIEPLDLCFYVSMVKEENYNWKAAKSKIFAVEEMYQNMLASGPDLTLRKKANDRVAAEEEINTNTNNMEKSYNVLEAHAGDFIEDKSSFTTEDNGSSMNASSHSHNNSFSHHRSIKNQHDIKNCELVVGRPPNLLYIGSNPTLCKLLKVPNQLCCLELNRECEHKTCIQASDYKWRNKCILLVAEYATNGLFNFILPLRAQVRSTMFLKPIVLLLENIPSIDFLEAISCFPLVYWMQGTINNINTVLKAGIMDSDTVIVVSPEKYAHIDDDSLTDCSNIVSVQNLYRLFPRVKVVTELTKATNIRFMNFRAKEGIKDQGSNIAYMHRLPFMSGNVFSASMIDTLLYQTFGKPYLIELIRLLIGISQSAGSGNLTSIPLTEEDMWLKTYGNLYRKLITSTGEIPIGLYRTKFCDRESGTQESSQRVKYSSKHDIQQMILGKLNKLGINPEKYKFENAMSEKFSFVLINPSCDYQLKAGDIIYLLKPGCNNNSSSFCKRAPIDVTYSSTKRRSSATSQSDFNNNFFITTSSLNEHNELSKIGGINNKPLLDETRNWEDKLTGDQPRHHRLHSNELNRILDTTSTRWNVFKKNMMPSFFNGSKSNNNRQQLDEKPDLTLRPKETMATLNLNTNVVRTTYH